MTNAQIAAQYCLQTKATLKVGGVWVSDNLPALSREQRREILSVYKRHFKYVDYNTTTGVCKCSDAPITNKPLSGDILWHGDTGGDHGQAVDICNIDIDKGNSTLHIVA